MMLDLILAIVWGIVCVLLIMGVIVAYALTWKHLLMKYPPHSYNCPLTNATKGSKVRS